MANHSIIDKNKEVNTKENETTKLDEKNVEASDNTAPPVTPVTTDVAKEKKTQIRLDENMLVNVVSRVKGGLIYVSPRTRIPYQFDDYGYENVMELSELRSMLSSQRKFFERGWIEVLDEEVVEYLRLERFNKKVVDQNDVDFLLESSSPESIKEFLSNANTNTRKIIFGFARDRYITGELNNIHTINAIEEVLNQKIDPNV